MPNTDMASIVGASASQNANLSGAISQILSDMKASSANTAAESSVAQSQAADTAVVTGQEESGKLIAQQNSRTAATALGTNMDDPSQIITSLSAKLLDTYAKANAAAQDVSDESANHPILSAFANALQKRGKPIGAIIGAAITGGASEKLAAYKNQAALLSGEINDINSTTQNIAKTQAELAPIRSVASVSAATDLAASAFTEKSFQYKQVGLQMNIEGVKAVAGLSQEQLGNSINVENLQLSIAQKQLAQQSLKLAIEDHADRIATREETEQGLSAYTGYVTAGLRALNPNAPVANLPPMKILQLIKTDPKQFAEAARIGLSQSLTGQLTISSDPGQAAVLIQQSGATLAPAQKPLKDLLNLSLGEAHAGKSSNGVVAPYVDVKSPVNTKDPLSVQEAAARNATYFAAHNASSIPFNDNSNIYQAPTLNSIAALPGMKGSPFFQQVIAPQVTSPGGSVGTDPQALADQAIAAVKAGTLKFPDAVMGLNLTFQAAIKLNNSMKQYDSVGLTPQHSYLTPLKDADGRVSNVDLSDSTKITRYLSQRLLNKSEYGTLGQAMGAY